MPQCRDLLRMAQSSNPKRHRNGMPGYACILGDCGMSTQVPIAERSSKPTA